MTSSPKVQTFGIVFSILYTATFIVAAPPFAINTALFRYYPAVNQWSIGPVADVGPAILWYGWMASAAIASLVIAMLVPRSLAARISPSAVWGIPAAVLFAIFVYERSWFY